MKLFPNGIEVTKWTAVKSLIVIALLCGAFFTGACLNTPFYQTGYKTGYDEGYTKCLSDVKDILGEQGITFSWQDLGNGAYRLSAYIQTESGKLLYAKGTVEIHLDTVLRDAYGNLKDYSHHAGTLTSDGKDFIEQQISGSASTTNAVYISCSEIDTSGWSNQSDWSIVADYGGSITYTELNSNGFTRATGSYVSTGVGAWNVTHTFSASGTQAVQTYMLNWSASSRTRDNGLCNDVSTAKNCVNGDTLAVTWQCTVS